MLPDHFDGLTLAYGFFNALRLVSYAPQIVLVARDKTGAAAISMASWLIWTGANATTALYAWIKLADAPLTLLNAFNTGCCAVVLALVACKRAKIAGRRAFQPAFAAASNGQPARRFAPAGGLKTGEPCRAKIISPNQN